MKPLDIKTAAILFKVSRSTIYGKIDKGELSRRPDRKLDFVELVRVFGEPSDRQTKHEKAQAISDTIQSQNDKKHHSALSAEREADLRSRVRELEDALRKADEREARLMGGLDKLTETIKLLNAPKLDKTTPKKQGFFGRIFKK